MGIDNILERISVEADKAAADEIAAAREKANALFNEKTEAAKKAAEESIAVAEKEAIERINHIKSTAALESRKLILAAKREVIEEVFEEIPDAFKKLSEDKYADFLANVAVKAANKGTLYFANADSGIADKVRDKLADKPQYKISKTTDKEITSGFIIKYDNVRIDCSLPAIAENMRSVLEPIAVSKLFSDNTEKK